MTAVTENDLKRLEDLIVGGMRESVIDALEIRFENVPSELVNKISQIQDTSLLKNLHRQAITLDSISDFQGYLNQLIKPE